ncbi:hypothetical protein PVAND_017297 [Polypedilum vanderplanki]|uniref:Uncharacterized protein n=1 Tax=Polypedilum vanderplanki TaxID=319348 RepID=A0A9J6BI74_POLVA|nr:hypothetical protein PVAND_017297 [Polypedilum vanderplanki]
MKTSRFLLVAILLSSVNSKYLRVTRNLILDTNNQTACPSEMFTCASGYQCIFKDYVCDSEKDCSDGSDEEICENKNCIEGQFKCANVNKCISKTWVCDNENDCGDMSDEINCNYTVKTCNENEYSCDNKKCIPVKWKCDGEDDCGDESDERNCTYVCSDNQFKCEITGACIPLQWKCDNEKDCTDGSDEKYCDYKESSIVDIQTTQSDCNENELRCEKNYFFD